MAAEVQVRRGTCKTDGSVEATRQIPRLAFPFLVYGVLRWRAKRQPFLCPVCDEPVEVKGEG